MTIEENPKKIEEPKEPEESKETKAKQFRIWPWLGIFTVAVALLVGLTYGLTLLVCGLKAANTLAKNSYDEFKNLGDSFGALVAALSVILWLKRASHNDEMAERDKIEKEKKEKEEKKITARYWMYYNIVNRLTEDIKFLDIYCSRLVKETWYSYPRITRIIARALENMKRGNPRKDDLGKMARIDYYDLRVDMGIIFRGFENTWKNDDILTDTIVFEFSLLDREEQDELTAYFESYSSIEDRVTMLRPFLNDSRKDEYDPASYILREIGEIAIEINRLIDRSLGIIQQLSTDGGFTAATRERTGHYLSRYEGHINRHKDAYFVLRSVLEDQFEGTTLHDTLTQLEPSPLVNRLVSNLKGQQANTAEQDAQRQITATEQEAEFGLEPLDEDTPGGDEDTP